MGDLLIQIGVLIKEYEGCSLVTINEEKTETSGLKLYSINEITKKFPRLSKHLITNAINNGKLKVTWLGNKRYFYLNDVENYLHQSERIQSSSENNIRNWRDAL